MVLRSLWDVVIRRTRIETKLRKLTGKMLEAGINFVEAWVEEAPAVAPRQANRVGRRRVR